MLERLFTEVDPRIAGLLEGALSGRELSPEDAVCLLEAEGSNLHALLLAGDVARREDNGDDVSFVVCRNLNFTNVCYVGCSFCGFARHKDDDAEAYDHPMEVLIGKCREAEVRVITDIESAVVSATAGRQQASIQSGRRPRQVAAIKILVGEVIAVIEVRNPN